MISNYRIDEAGLVNGISSCSRHDAFHEDLRGPNCMDAGQACAASLTFNKNVFGICCHLTKEFELEFPAKNGF